MKFLPFKGDKWEIHSSQFKVGTKLGEGNYGQVYKGTLSMDVATAPAKKYAAMQSQEGKSPYTVAIKLLKGILTDIHTHTHTHTHTLQAHA